jgi:hypothetical protein
LFEYAREIATLRNCEGAFGPLREDVEVLLIDT